MRTNTQLALLRGELDLIDDAMLALLEQRLTLCRRIADAKPTSGVKLCPDRQRTVINRLTARANDDAARAVPHVWREIMAHGVQVQSVMPVLIPEGPNRDKLLCLARAQYGSAAPVEWVANTADALNRAVREKAIVVLPTAMGRSLPEGLVVLDRLTDEAGIVVGLLVGRALAEVQPSPSKWHPGSWRTRPTQQQPQYPNLRELQRVERRLSTRAPLVELNDIDALRRQLAEAAMGRAILLQGGDCVETEREASAEKVRLTADLLLSLGQGLSQAADCPVVHVGRMAGQYAKPRSSPSEIVDGQEIPVYRGDGVNGEDANAASRIADPQRLLTAYDQAAETLGELWDRAPSGSHPVYASHEALLLGAEQAMTHYDERSGRWWAGSGHMLWIGERTRQLDGGHIEYARGIANPIGLKVGPTMGAEELLRLVDRLDPSNEAGRLTLIPRLGKDKIGAVMPTLMRAMKREGRNLLWCVDPMHGNTRTMDGRKTRLLGDIIAETLDFHDIAMAEGVWAGGIHLELTGTDVLECRDNARRWMRLGSRPPYLSGCDPRLNPAQVRELGLAVAAWHAPVQRRKAG